MKNETAIGAAIKRAGGPTLGEARFNIAIAEFLNQGGSITRGHELLDAAAERMSGEGRMSIADAAVLSLPSARQQNGDGEAATDAPQGPRSSASPSPTDRASEGLQVDAKQGQIPVAPSREPTKTDITAMVSARKNAANVIFAVNGIDVRHFTIGACLSEGRRKGKEHYILSVIGGMYKHLPHTMHVGDLMSDDELKKLVRQAEAYANAA